MVATIQDARSVDDFSKLGLQKFLKLIASSKKSAIIYLLYSYISDLDYHPPHRNYINKQLKRLCTRYVGSMLDLLSKVPFIAVTTDIWSDNKGLSYSVLTGHYINQEFNLNSTTLCFSSFQKRHYSELIGAEIEKQLVELNIFEKVTSITCDSAPTMIKMFDYLTRSDIIRIRCQGHLHLIVCNGLTRWFDKKKNKESTTDETNLIDPEERLSQSLQTINIIDNGESIGDGTVESNDDVNEDIDGNEDRVLLFPFLQGLFVYSCLFLE